MFILASAFEFKHLPMAGGLYDQKPELLDRFLYILQKQEEHRQKKEAEESKNRGGPNTSKQPRRPGRTSRPTR